MALLIVALGGAIGLVCILGLLDRAWRRAGALRYVPPDALIGSAEDVEREATADLFAGRISPEHYRTLVAALAIESDGLLNRPAR